MNLNNSASASLLMKSANKLKSAESNFLSGRIDSCVSDLYYSAFQSVCALMVSRGKSTSKHTHVRLFINKELALKGILSLELSKMYNKLMDMRCDADYSTEITFTPEDVEIIVDQVRKFNQEILLLIEKQILRI